MDDKFILQSKTIWGILIVFATNVVPILGPFIGLDISPALIADLGAQGNAAISAIGGLVGSILAVYGRVKARTTVKVLPA